MNLANGSQKGLQQWLTTLSYLNYTYCLMFCIQISYPYYSKLPLCFLVFDLLDMVSCTLLPLVTYFATFLTARSLLILISFRHLIRWADVFYGLLSVTIDCLLWRQCMRMQTLEQHPLVATYGNQL